MPAFSRLIHLSREAFHFTIENGLGDALNTAGWIIKTALQKKTISLQDRFGLYTYTDWRKKNTPGPTALAEQARSIQNLTHQPLISVLIPLSHPEITEFQNTVQSLYLQTYQKWEVCLASSQEIEASKREQIASFFHEQRRFYFNPSSRQTGQADPVVEALSIVSGEFVLLLNPGDLLSPEAFYQVVSYLNQAPQVDGIYFDEDRISKSGQALQDPFFKPDWSPELLLSVNYLLHAVFRSSLMASLAAQSLAEGKSDYGDLVFRCIEQTRLISHIPQVLYHARQASDSQSERMEQAAELQYKWVQAHLLRTGTPGARALLSKGLHVQVKWPSPEKRASIIIPTLDNIQYLRRCITSIRELTAYSNYEIILVDSGSREDATLEYYDELQRDANISKVDYTTGGEFNFSAALNLGARNAQGEIFVFLNNDTEIIDPIWLEELAAWAERPEIGITGAKLLYPNGTIQHAGVVIGLEGHANHIFFEMSEGNTSPYGSVDWYRNYSAVTGACMAIRREVFEELGGFDEDYQLAFSDIEICTRAIQAGYRVVYTPYARLIHYEGKTRFRYIPKHDILRAYAHLKEKVEQGDPFYNPNLSFAVSQPTLKRPGEEAPISRLKHIVDIYAKHGDVANE
jgi:O-antigen biosynthesis protein